MEKYHGFHGDVILVSSSIPASSKKKSRTHRGYILAEGEVTGHAHCVQEEIDLFEKEGKIYIKAMEPFSITHEEHNKVTVPSGEYEVRIAKEYDHFSEEVREVMD